MSAHNKVSAVRLEYHSLRFAKMLFKRFPQWKSCSGYYVEDKKGTSVYHLDVSVPSANSNVMDALRITAYPGEIIVAWLGGAHSHFNPWMGNGAVGYMEVALDYLEHLIADKVVFGYYVQNGKPTGAGFSYDTDFTSSDFIPEMEWPNIESWLNTEGNCMVIRSWHGMHDRERFELTDTPVNA